MTDARSTVPPPPPETDLRRDAVPWTLTDVLLVGVLTLFVAAPLTGTLASAALPEEVARAVSVPAIMLAFAATTVVWIALRYGGRVRMLLGSERARLRHVVAGAGHGVVAFFGLNLLLGLLFVFLTELVGIEVAPVQQRIRDFAAEPVLVPFLLVSVVFAAPLAEELFFRGLLFQWLRARAPGWAAIVVSSVVFGLAHWEAGNLAGALYMVVSLSLVGAYLAVVFHRRRSIVAPIAMHATFNLLAAIWILQGIG